MTTASEVHSVARLLSLLDILGEESNEGLRLSDEDAISVMVYTDSEDPWSSIPSAIAASRILTASSLDSSAESLAQFIHGPYVQRLLQYRRANAGELSLSFPSRFGSGTTDAATQIRRSVVLEWVVSHAEVSYHIFVHSAHQLTGINSDEIHH